METSNAKPRRQRKKKPVEWVDKGPKDTKVVLVNPSLFLMLKPENASSSSQTTPCLPASCHFPALGSRAKELPDKDSPVCKEGEQLDVKKSTDETNEPIRRAMRQPGLSPAIKVKRSKKAISLDLTSILKAKNKLQHKGGRMTIKRRKFQRNDTLSGNILDSSMPIRKRGKVREIKRIKLSPLKTAIIKDRILKAIRKASVDGEEICLSQIDLKKEIENYLVRSRMKRNSKEKLEPTGEISDVKQSNNAVAKKENKIFHRKFQSYCENCVTPELNAAVKQLIQHLVSLQDQAFYRDPVRARARKRFVVGFREAAKYLKLKSVKLLILAPDLENSGSDGAINNVIQDLKAQATVNDIPYVFALDRRKLGYCSLRKVPVSAFAVLNYEGLETFFQTTLDEYFKTRNDFLQQTSLGEITATSSDPSSLSEILEKLTVNVAED